MAMINCPECERRVLDKAVSCPGCGYPLRQDPGVSKKPVPDPVTSGKESPSEGNEDFSAENTKMGRPQAIFEILYLLAAIDGEFHEEEMNVIANLLEAGGDNIDFDLNAVVNSLSKLGDMDAIRDEIIRAAKVFRDLSNDQDRLAALDLALHLTAIDDSFSPDEKLIFVVLARMWNIDLAGYLASKGLRSATS
ncbi:TerB family tellurite resistance protein [bacterium]|nr:TerB family tellurite resistance protein [bacterium]